MKNRNCEVPKQKNLPTPNNFVYFEIPSFAACLMLEPLLLLMVLLVVLLALLML